MCDFSALILVQSSPAKNTKKCAAECPTDEDIICAKGDGLEFAFLNECVLAKSNCENNRGKFLYINPCMWPLFIY